MEYILELKKLSKHFGGLAAVNDVDFRAPSGIITSIIGPNGAGKTTMFNLITGFHIPTSGEVRFEGQTITGARPFQLTSRGIARTFQTTNYFSEKTVEQNLMVGRHVKQRARLWHILARSSTYRREEQELRHKAQEVMEFLDIKAFSNDLAKEVPTVVKQLLAIGMALMSEPRLLLLDEPTSGMTAEEMARLMSLIHDIRDRGTTVILIEHRMKMVMGISEHIMVLNFGEKIAEGTPEQIRKNSTVIQAYLGKEYVI
ncbi:MAG: ABC transporter ATP-binding protein [Pseudomonadota bacterium]